MSTVRNQRVCDAFPYRPVVDGIRPCAVCGKSCRSVRFKFCGEKCRDYAYIRCIPSYARQKVRERDKGICAICGFDTEKLSRILRHARRQMGSNHGNHGSQAKGVLTEIREAIGLPPYEALWQADHITPVVEGGGMCGLENYRTLCALCHRKETKALAARRARKHRALKEELPLFEVA